MALWNCGQGAWLPRSKRSEGARGRRFLHMVRLLDERASSARPLAVDHSASGNSDAAAADDDDDDDDLVRVSSSPRAGNQFWRRAEVITICYTSEPVFLVESPPTF